MVIWTPPVASNEIRIAILASSPVSGSRCRAMEEDLLQPRARGRRQHPLGEELQFGAGEVARRPDVDDDPVGGEPGAGRPPGLGPADRVEARRQGVLRRGQGGQAAVGLAQLDEVADLRQGDQPVVGRVLLRHAAEQVDLLVGGGQAGQVERAQPLQLHALGDVGCRPRISRSSSIPAPEGRKVKWWCMTAPPAAGDGEGEPADRRRERVEADHGAQLGGGLGGVVRLVLPDQVDVGVQGVVAGGERRPGRAERVAQAR